MNLTGKPSVDKPWLQFYPEQLRNVEVPKMTIEEFLKFKNQDENRIAFEYYGNKITWKTLRSLSCNSSCSRSCNSRYTYDEKKKKIILQIKWLILYRIPNR